jgi:1-acyl-sn-glycerol-3-phosphate acyltransferase
VASHPPENLFLGYIRRLVTVTLFCTATVVATLLLPVLAPLCWLVSARAGTRGALRSGAFLLCYLWCETIGIAASFWLWLRHGMPTRSSCRWSAFLDGNYALQCWWANALKVAAQRLFTLRFTITGDAALEGAPPIMLPRHASIADTIIPMVFYAIPHRVRLRYVLKRELLFDPCLDIVGNRLPNCFVTRSGVRTDVDAIVALARDLGPADGLLIYPEGTRFSSSRRTKILASLEPHTTPAQFEQMRRWVDLLPPHIGGTRALIETAPDRDVVFCAHVGFENASHFRTLINGSWIGADIRIFFWRVRAADVPKGDVPLRDFLFTQWDRMQATVAILKTT